MEPTLISTSASPEKAEEEFNGIDPDDTKEITIRGATFVVGVMPSGLWDMISAQHILKFEAAKRRAIKLIADAGEDPEAPWEEGKTASKMEMVASLDKQFMRENFRNEMDAVKYALREHKNWKTKSKAIPLTFTTEGAGEEKVQVVSAETLRYYEANPKIVSALWVLIMSLHQLSYLAKKA